MAIYVVDHKVRNFGEWKEVYDAFQTFVRESGIKDHSVLRSINDPNHVVVIGEGSVEDLQKFLTSEPLKAEMSKAGVVGTPTIFIGENQD